MTRRIPALQFLCHPLAPKTVPFPITRVPNSKTHLGIMSENASSDSDTQETDSNPSSSSEELESPKNRGTQKKKKMTEYEKQRAKRIEENRTRMEALGLRKMACSVMASGRISKEKKREAKGKQKGKSGEEDDEEYRPEEEGGEEGLSSSSGEDDDGEGTSGGRRSKAKQKHSASKKSFDQNLTSNSDFVDDDEALFQAIALSLKDSTECSNGQPNEHSQSSNAHLSDSMMNARKENAHVQEDTGKRKRKKPVASRVKMTEDEFLIHFFQFDESGKGGITLRDLKRVAAAHDFTWTDKEMADMICCFDSDGDGKLSLDDFRKIADQCNMIGVQISAPT